MSEVMVQEKDKNIELIMPTLELESIDDPVVNELQVQDAESFRMQQFSDSEIDQINDFAEKIDLHDTNLIITYGAGAQKRLSDFSEETLKHVRNKDLDEVGPLLSKLMVDLKHEPEEKKGIFGIFSKATNKLEETRAYYTKVEKSIDSIAESLGKHQDLLLKDITVLDKLYENNKTYFKELTMYIAAGKIALKKALEEELPQMKARATETGLAEDAQDARDFASMCERFEKKLHDLDLTRAVCLQNAPQIRLIQSNAVVLSDKIQTTLLNTIPLWKNQLVITMGMAHSQEAVQAQQMVTNTTNEILKKNAEMLHQGTVAIANENERGIVDIETLKHTNEELIATIDDLMKIQSEGRAKRQQAELELTNIENQLKQKMLEASNR
ncbi:MAG: toxic anion resistance protein [Firmicutes bacterium]|nr:toxic anion resistance protein [Bacillota bacterium]